MKPDKQQNACSKLNKIRRVSNDTKLFTTRRRTKGPQRQPKQPHDAPGFATHRQRRVEIMAKTNILTIRHYATPNKIKFVTVKG